MTCSKSVSMSREALFSLVARGEQATKRVKEKKAKAKHDIVSKDRKGMREIGRVRNSVRYRKTFCTFKNLLQAPVLLDKQRMQGASRFLQHPPVSHIILSMVPSSRERRNVTEG